MRSSWPTDLVTIDLDSTLADTRPRQKMVDEWNAAGGGHDWLAYSLECPTDLPGPAVPLAHALEQAGHAWAVLSARDEAARGLTWGWLNRYDLHPRFLLLGDERWTKDRMPHGEWKAQRIREIHEGLVRLYDPAGPDSRTMTPHGRGAGSYRVRLHVDDRADVFAPLAAIGVPALIVRTPGEVEHFGAEHAAMTGDERTARKIGL